MNNKTTRGQDAGPRLPFCSFQFQPGDSLEIQTRRQFKTELIRRAAEDEGFRQDLIKHPKAVVERTLGTWLPEEVQIRVLEESESNFHFVIPANPCRGFDQPELRDLPGRNLHEVAWRVCQNRTIGGVDDRISTLVTQSWTKVVFRWNLPMATREGLREATSMRIPATVEVTIWFEEPSVLYLVLPRCDTRDTERMPTWPDAL